MILSFLLFDILTYKEPEYVKLTHQINSKVVKEIKKNKGYVRTGGGGSLYKNVKAITLTFQANECLTIEEARKCYVELVEQFVAEYNKNVQIRPFLDNYPFLPKNVELHIFFNKIDPHVPPPHVSLIMMLSEGKLDYSLTSSTGEPAGIHQEPYDTAYKLVYGHDRENWH